MISEAQIDAAVRQLFDEIEFEKDPKGLYDPLRYMMSIGGKRIRPKLCLTAYSLFKDSLEDSVMNVAAALEVFHTFTLIHDDIMDRSPLRRGKETVWKKWNEDAAILSGDVMLIDSYKRICRVSDNVRGAVLDLFSCTGAGVCEGQQLDVDYESEKKVSMAEYEKMIGLKTAVLLACAAKMGALVGGASDSAADALYNYGYQLGMAFQVADDYLDAYGEESVFGKPIGGDIINNKKSWLLTRAFEKCSDEKMLVEAMAMPVDTDGQKTKKIKTVKEIYESLGVDQDAKLEIERFSDLAIKEVSGLNLSAVHLEALRRFASKLIGRAK